MARDAPDRNLFATISPTSDGHLTAHHPAVKCYVAYVLGQNIGPDFHSLLDFVRQFHLLISVSITVINNYIKHTKITAVTAITEKAA